jgi:hypothetical protein
MEGKHGAGKGDTYRKLDYEKWSRGWDMIFAKKKKFPPLKKGKNGQKK